jgi:hypothetical protein
MAQRAAIGIGLAAAALALAACQTVPEGPAGAPPPARPVTPTPQPPSAESEAARAYYAQVERTLLAQGLLRGEGGGPDTPFTAEQLAANFMRIALFDELVETGGSYVARQTASELRRWAVPVRIEPVFGATVPAARRMADASTLEAYARRLARVTGHPVRTVPGGGNFPVLFLSEDERRDPGAIMRAYAPAISDTAIRTVATMPRDVFCIVFAISDGRTPDYRQALAVIRAEHPDALRRACIHEEVAQALGLPNDSPAARPSIFNDDEEFGLLTTHDEYLLNILYDPRLKPGMRAAEARPIVEAIARELIGGES